MRNLKLLPLTPELHREVCADVRDPVVATWIDGEQLIAQRCNEFGYALTDARKAVAAGGLIPIWPGTAEAWLLVGHTCNRRQLVPALRHAARVLDYRQADPRFRRIQMFVRWTAPWRVSFAAALGFDIEGRLKSWGPDGADYALYARIALPHNWRDLDSVGSYNDALAAIGERVRAGEPPPAGGYF